MDFNDIKDAFNVQVNTTEKNRIRVYTLEAVVGNIASQLQRLGYSSISGTYENLRAMLYGMIVVEKNGSYGVLATATREEIAGTKYKEVLFVQNAKEFLVTADNSVGLISIDGSTIIKPTEYDEISVLDQIEGLYMVKKGKKYGVLNRRGEVVVYVENDAIGYKNAKNFKGIEKNTLFFNNIIPVQKGDVFGAYNTEGREVLPIRYDGFGYEVKSTDGRDEESVLIIPESVGIKGIVINQDDLYGIFDAEGQRILIPVVNTKIYSVTKSGKTTYYMEYNGQQLDIEQYVTENR